MLQDVLLFNDLERCQCCGTTDRAFLMGVMAKGAIPEDIQVFPGDECSQWKDSASQAFADDKHIGHNLKVFAGKHLPGSSQADRNFIKNQQCAMAIAGLPDFLPVISWRNERGATDCLCNHRRDISFFFQDIFDVIRTFQVAGTIAPPETTIRIGRGDMLRPRQEWPDTASENFFTSHRDCIE